MGIIAFGSEWKLVVVHEVRQKQLEFLWVHVPRIWFQVKTNVFDGTVSPPKKVHPRIDALEVVAGHGSVGLHFLHHALQFAEGIAHVTLAGIQQSLVAREGTFVLFAKLAQLENFRQHWLGVIVGLRSLAFC